MWTQLVLVTDADLGAIEPQATASGRPWGQDTWPVARAMAMADLRVWIDLTFADIPSASDRVLERWAFPYVLAHDGVRYTNDWQAQARDDNENDLPIGAILADANASLIPGAGWTYEGVYLKVATPNAIPSVLSVDYYGPAGWTAVAVTDDTAVAGVTLAQTGRVRFTNGTPTDWEPVRLNQGDEYLWLRLRVSVGLTPGAMLTQAVAVRPAEALKRCAAFLAMAYVKRGLADGAADPASWQTSADTYEAKARDLFAQLQTNGIALDLGRSQVINPESHERLASAPVKLGRG